MLRRTVRRFDLHTTTTDSGSFRAAYNHNPMAGVLHSPWKDAMKEYWATPIPWQQRDYGPKPKPGDPVPLRQSASALIIAKNSHIDPALVEAGEDNDYKVLMQFREAKGRYQKDSFVFPGAPIHLEDRHEDWGKLLYRLGLRHEFEDIDERLCAYRSLFAECNLLVLPPEGGGLAEVEGPPGPRKWHMYVAGAPNMIRHLVDILDVPIEPALMSLRPFVRIQSPAAEVFRYDNKSFIIPIEKVPCVKYTISTVGEELIWVSPKEALARFETGVMEMPTPNVMIFHELDRRVPTYDQVKALTHDNVPPVLLPELIHDKETNMATVLMPTDIHHSKNVKRVERRRRRQQAQEGLSTPAETAGASSEAAADEADAQQPPSVVDYYARFEFTKDIPWGVRSTFLNRAIAPDEEVQETFERVKDLTASEAEVKQLEFREEQSKVFAKRLKTAANPEMQRLAKMLPKDAGDDVVDPMDEERPQRGGPHDAA
jgi:hypothetical protein